MNKKKSKRTDLKTTLKRNKPDPEEKTNLIVGRKFT